MSIKFYHFVNDNGVQFESAIIKGYQIDEAFDDIDFKVTIKDNKLSLSVVNDNGYFTDEDVESIQSDLSHYSLDQAYEFVSFFDKNTNDELRLVADKNSTTFNVINSQTNINNLNNFGKAFSSWANGSK